MPVNLAIGLTNYYILKKKLGIVNDKTGKKRLFTDISGHPLSVKGLSSSPVYKIVCGCMGVVQLQITQNRVVMSTEQAIQDLKEDTGMDNTRYDTRPEVLFVDYLWRGKISVVVPDPQ
jgi:hypothetical protein